MWDEIEAAALALRAARAAFRDLPEKEKRARGAPAFWRDARIFNNLCDEESVLALIATLQAAERERDEAREALKPFVAVLEDDISLDEEGGDLFRPMLRFNIAPRLTVGDFRRARSVLTGETGA